MMLKKLREAKNISRLLVFSFACLLVIFFALPWVTAKETPPKPQDWQLNGILAAVDDVYPRVQGFAFSLLEKYDLKSLDKQKAEHIAKIAGDILKDDKVDASIRSDAASALGNLELSAKPYIPDIVALLKDDEVDTFFRLNAASALGNLGEATKSYIPDILTVLKGAKIEALIIGKNPTTSALGNFGLSAKSYIPDILAFLKNDKVGGNIRADVASTLRNLVGADTSYIPDFLTFLKNDKVDRNVRAGVASALGNLVGADTSYIPDFLAFLKDDKVDGYVRAGAASALGNFGSSAKSYIPDIDAIFKNDKIDINVRCNAASALGHFGLSAKSYVPDILSFLKKNNHKETFSFDDPCAFALENFGLSVKSYIPDILAIIKDDKIDKYTRGSAAFALGNLGEVAKSYIPDIAAIFKDDKIDKYVRRSAALALSDFGLSAKSYIPDILAFLKDDKIDTNFIGFGSTDTFISPVIPALGKFGLSAKSHIPDILTFLRDDKINASVRIHVASELEKIGQLNIEQAISVLDLFYRPGESGLDLLRFLTYITAGGTDEVKTLLKYLGHYDQQKARAQLQQVNYEEAKKALNVFAKIWKLSEGLRLRNDLANQIALVASKVTWKAGDIALLQGHYNNLKNANYTQYDTIGRIIQNLEYWKWIFVARNTILIHLAFWLLLVFAYPQYPQVQAIFFWNPWVRRILGMVYVGFILTWIPFFRRKLLEPFKPSLLADARLDGFNPDVYFPESNVKLPSGDILPITQALRSIDGQIILEGDSGLGKSMFLRYLANKQERIVVFLPAFKCQKGVSEAIQDKLHGQAQDANFLRSLIYSGAIDIYIDGINEVSAETRAKICEFVEKHFRGNVIITTQPLEWVPPNTAKTYHLQPLNHEQIKRFLFERALRLGNEAKIKGDDYKKACERFLGEIFNNQITSLELNVYERILSNPMDLSLVSIMISQAQHPDLFNLQQQQYNLMSAEYSREWKHDFPLKKFSVRIYQLRCHDETVLPVDEFNQEIMSMEDEKYKMVVRREWLDVRYGQPRKEWNFRHDKIMEFFLVQNFLDGSQEAEERQMKHMGDSRFRGVYFSLASLLPLNEAHELREKLIRYAVNTNDYTVMGTYEKLLQARMKN